VFLHYWCAHHFTCPTLCVMKCACVTTVHVITSRKWSVNDTNKTVTCILVGLKNCLARLMSAKTQVMTPVSKRDSLASFTLKASVQPQGLGSLHTIGRSVLSNTPMNGILIEYRIITPSEIDRGRNLKLYKVICYGNKTFRPQ